MTSIPVIQTFGLSKHYGSIQALDDLNLTVHSGDIFGFLGPNGAGKTTTIRLLLDLIHPTRGRAEALGLDTRRDSLAIRRRTGYLAGDVALYQQMTGRGLLSLLDDLRGGGLLPRGYELAERLDLDLSPRISSYSSGMKQKLAFIAALMPRAELLILDEPTKGLDPLVQLEVYAILKEEHERGCTVFFSSHILPEVERVCNRVGIVREGRLVAVEDVESIRHKRVRLLTVTFSRPVPAAALRMEGVELRSLDGNRAHLAVHGHVPDLLRRLAELPVEDFVFPEAALEDTFMRFYSEESAQ
ncbi:MAG: ABC transporter ATP-binding protein [Dehalococcoidia bacterium]